MDEARLKFDLEILNKEAALGRKSVSDVFLNRNILWIPTNTNLESTLKVRQTFEPLRAYQIMKDNNIISLPVMDVVQNTCVGVIDVLDIAAFIAGIILDD